MENTTNDLDSVQPDPQEASVAPESLPTPEQTTTELDDGLVIDDSARVEIPTPEATAPVAVPTDTATPVVAATEEAPADEEKPIVTPYPPADNVQLDYNIFEPLGEKDDIGDVVVPIAADTIERTEEALSAQPNIELSDSAADAEWRQTLENSSYTRPFHDFFISTVQRKGAKFRQRVDSERGPLVANKPKFRETEGVKVSGERALLRVRSLLGMGSIVQIPLWHSGFWVTLKAPGESDLLELHRRITEEKILMGRQTYGMAFANTSVFFAGWLTDFVMRHLYDTTLKDAEDFRAQISSLDLPILVWGIACTIWPRGFQYARSVLDQTKTPSKVIRERLNLGKILWVDTASLSAWQISHMANRNPNSMTMADIEKYRKEFLRGQPRQVELTDQLKITLRVPSVDQYLVSGQKWINNIVTMVDSAFGLPPGDDTRNTYIRDQGRATNMRQLGHWIESIEAGSNLIEDTETIEKVLDAMSSEQELRNKYFLETRKYMEDSTVAIIAVPAAEEGDVSTLPRFPHLLPLDTLSTFFILLVQKTMQIQSRF